MALRKKKPDNWYGKRKTSNERFYGTLRNDDFTIEESSEPVLDGETILETEELEDWE